VDLSLPAWRELAVSSRVRRCNARGLSLSLSSSPLFFFFLFSSTAARARACGERLTSPTFYLRGPRAHFFFAHSQQTSLLAARRFFSPCVDWRRRRPRLEGAATFVFFLR